jgi:hypothetical protein
MDILPKYLQYGEESSHPARSVIYTTGDPIGEKPIYYVIAGLVKVEYPLGESSFTLWVPPEGIFGLVEALAECERLCVVHAMEGFFTAAGVSYELGRFATKGLIRELRILNAEFGERLGLQEGSIH